MNLFQGFFSRSNSEVKVIPQTSSTNINSQTSSTNLNSQSSSTNINSQSSINISRENSTIPSNANEINDLTTLLQTKNRPKLEVFPVISQEFNALNSKKPKPSSSLFSKKNFYPFDN